MEIGNIQSVENTHAISSFLKNGPQGLSASHKAHSSSDVSLKVTNPSAAISSSNGVDRVEISQEAKAAHDHSAASSI